jgi:diguanylate cyclase (GGDEF)-like protein
MPDSYKRPTIGFLSANIHLGAARALWHGVVQAAAEMGANLVCFPGGGIGVRNEQEARRNILYELVNPERLDGLISWATTLGVAMPHSGVVEFHRRFAPLPLISVALPMEGIPAITGNGYTGMRSVVQHLVEVHKLCRLVFLSGPESHYGAQERYRAYRDVLAEAGLALDPRLVTPPLPWEAGSEAMRILLDERGLAPGVDFDAIVAVSDLSALAAMSSLQARGVQVPEQVAVTGFNDSTEGRLTSPPLTSVTLQLYEQGRRAVAELLGIIQGMPAPDQVMLPSNLVVRQSCGCPPQAVLEAAIGSAPGEAARGKAAKAHREQLRAELMKAVVNPEWPAQLLDAFDAVIRGGSPWIFLNTFEKILRQVAALEGDITAWQGVVSALRRYSLSDLDVSARLRCEDVCGQARVIIGEVAQWSQAYHQMQADAQAETLREIGQALITTFDIEKLADVLAQQLPHLGIHSGYMGLYDSPVEPLRGARLVLAYSEQGRVPLPPGGLALPARQLVPEELLPQRRYGYVAEPLFFREEMIGYLLLEVGPMDGAVHEVLRAQISSALKGALLFREAQGQRQQLAESEALLKELAIRDPLTGLFNRRYLEETLAREINRSARKQLSLGVIMIDIDHFKRFNDRYGHATGDELLLMIGECFRQHVRESDVPCRYGGEEFVLVLPETPQEVIHERAELLREAVKRLHVSIEGQPVESVTISCGIAASPQHGDSPQALLKAADDALYRAKDAGRDRVETAH